MRMGKLTFGMNGEEVVMVVVCLLALLRMIFMPDCKSHSPFAFPFSFSSHLLIKCRKVYSLWGMNEFSFQNRLNRSSRNFVKLKTENFLPTNH